MKIKYLKLKNWFLVSLMSILGLTACKSSKDLPDDGPNRRRPFHRNEIMLMYGVPTRDFSDSEPIVSDPENLPVDAISQDTIPSKNPRSEIIAMYGVPAVDYSLKGRVVDSKGNPVKGAQVIILNSNIDADANHLPSNEFWDQELKRISDTTDAQGNFSVKTSDTPWEQPRILVRDIDGKLNGTFQNEVFPIDYSDVTPTSQSKGWYQGKKEKTNVTIKVKQ